MASEPTLDKALRQARAAGLDRSDAQWLLADVMDRPRAWLLAHPDAVLTPDQAAAWQDCLLRYRQGEPLDYLLGWTEFHGLRLEVGPAVLIPRPDTETLVRWALERLAGHHPSARAPRVLDLGTGSGAIALALRQACSAAEVTASDASAEALAVAASNGRRLGLTVDWRQGDWWDAVAGEPPFTLIVSNPPYIADDDEHLPDLRHEPRAALCAGADGLDDLRRIVAGAAAHLQLGGWLLLEHGWTQAEQMCRLLVDAGFEEVGSRRDLAGRLRCSGGRRPAP